MTHSPFEIKKRPQGQTQEKGRGLSGVGEWKGSKIIIHDTVLIINIFSLAQVADLLQDIREQLAQSLPNYVLVSLPR